MFKNNNKPEDPIASGLGPHQNTVSLLTILQQVFQKYFQVHILLRDLEPVLQ